MEERKFSEANTGEETYQLNQDDTDNLKSESSKLH